MRSLSNWGRWGPDDELGTLNYITPEKRRAAATLVREGEVVSCARPISYEPDLYGAEPRHTTHWTEGSAPVPWRINGDEFLFQPHGVSITHLDALSHLAWDGRMYNGRPAELVTGREGATAHSIEAVARGVVTRGVLLDMPRLRDRPWLEPGEGIFPEDLEEAERSHNVRVASGDVLLVRTGHLERTRREGRPPDDARPGLQAACLPWLHARQVAMIGCDMPQDVRPSGYPTGPGRCPMGPVHVVGIVAMGLWLLDNCDHEALAEACARHGRWEFQFLIAPLALHHGTASPVNPLAVF
jgi:kynurenine formamidase